ncbi:MAG: hypothetical protein IPI54_17380 [Chitinophagaceae bacterium]|nr:hypothetical protein [Chitinophagaceae bacterium]
MVCSGCRNPLLHNSVNRGTGWYPAPVPVAVREWAGMHKINSVPVYYRPGWVPWYRHSGV